MIIFAWPEQSALALHVAAALGIPVGEWSLHTFPDTELKVTVSSPVNEEDVWLIANLHEPNEKIFGLILLAETCRSLGARSVKLVAPYLAYMRQDKRFHPGESVSAHVFAGLLSHYFDGLVTVDPHCHRIPHLSDVYTIPCVTLHAQLLFKMYIESHVTKPLVIGPDAESEQWMAALAKSLDAPYLVLKKQRLGDEEVVITVPDLSQFKDRTPVFIDDIISTGKTLMVPIDQLLQQGFKAPYVIAVHGLFAGDAYEALTKRTSNIVTTNSIPHSSNDIDLSLLLAEGMRDAH